MSHPEAGTNTWHGLVTVPDDADPDPRDATAIELPLEALLDRTQYLYQRTALGAITVTSIALATPLNIGFHVPLNPIFDPSDWQLGRLDASGLPRRRIYRTTTAVASWILLPLTTARPGMTLTGFNVKCAAGSSATALPGTTGDRLRAGIFRQQMTESDPDAQLSLVGTVVDDTSSSLGAYKALHFIAGSSIGHAVGEGYHYYVGFRSDVNGFAELYQVDVTLTASYIWPGGA